MDLAKDSDHGEWLSLVNIGCVGRRHEDASAHDDSYPAIEIALGGQQLGQRPHIIPDQLLPLGWPHGRTRAIVVVVYVRTCVSRTRLIASVGLSCLVK